MYVYIYIYIYIYYIYIYIYDIGTWIRQGDSEAAPRPRVLVCHGDADPFVTAEGRAAPRTRRLGGGRLGFRV